MSMKMNSRRTPKLIQVIFTADAGLKSRVFKKAKQEGITLKSLFIFCMKAFLQGKISVTVVGSEKLPRSRGIKFFRTEEEKLQAQAVHLLKTLRHRFRFEKDQPPDTPSIYQ